MYGPGYGVMGDFGYGYGGFGAVHMIVWAIILVALVVGIVWLVRSMTVGSGGASSAIGRRSAGLDALEERYARGEINRDEYLQKKRDIGG